MDAEYVFQPMLTCIGNKRKLVGSILNIVEDVRQKMDEQRLVIVDGFAGSGVVSRALSALASRLYCNDLEIYSDIMNQCYLVPPSTNDDKKSIHQHIERMNELAEKGPFIEGIISQLYAPKDTNAICEGERCFYTRENALIIDTLRQYIADHVPEHLVSYCLGPLLVKASIHANTAGVFKGFYKKGKIGWFGGAGENALSRIKKPIRLDIPVWSSHGCSDVRCSKKDINRLVEELPEDIDIMYLDPPYNQHPYGSNYFMLNIIAQNKEPEDISMVSGIPRHWNKSAYNSRRTAVEAMQHLVSMGLTKAKYVLISYNNEGIIKPADWTKIFEGFEVKTYEIKYDTYKGSRNLRKRSNKVIEIMHLVSKCA